MDPVQNKSSAKEIFAIAIVPIFMIIVIFTGVFLPKLVPTPTQDFVYFDPGYSENNDYSKFSVNSEGKIEVAVPARPSQSSAGTQNIFNDYSYNYNSGNSYNDETDEEYEKRMKDALVANLKFYDVSEDRVRQLTGADVEKLRIDTAATSRDGFILKEKDDREDSVFSSTYDGYYKKWELVKSPFKHELKDISIYSYGSNGGNLHFIGWVK